MDTLDPKLAIPGSFRKPPSGARLLNSADPDEIISVTLYARRNPFPPADVKALHNKLSRSTAGTTPLPEQGTVYPIVWCESERH